MLYSRTKDLAGQKFGRLTALFPVGRDNSLTIWRCRCQCGTEKDVRGTNLTQLVNPVKSCGCATGFMDLTGRKFSSWTVLRRHGRDASKNIQWLCECECGVRKLVTGGRLKNERSKSCGCKIREMHGMVGTTEYMAWQSMLQRCHNPRHSNFKHYGARGIFVCDQWRRSFTDFISHIGKKPDSALSLDRIDNEKGYEPGNVRWATAEQQQNNTRRQKL